MSVEIAVNDPSWTRDLPAGERTVRRAALAALKGRLGAGPAELSVLLTDDQEMRRLNREYRAIDAPTNVLAFESDAAGSGAVRLLGDVALAFGTLRREAEERGIETADHLAHLVVHGVLHLLGYDHDTDGTAAVMERTEAEILARLGVADPYAGEMSGGVNPTRER
ncbi:MAG: rRNA maturation RNase YbeY [Alphaproteobacteria bacterium]|nr:rRNA maturation RNase YbeY [Alphaproteobacteria bacterium]